MKQYINWKTENGTKVPVSPQGYKINHLDPANWMERDEALKHGKVAVVLTANDPYFVVDIDNCRVGDGWDERSQAVFTALPGAAVEVSQSGNGLHLMGRCDGERVAVLRNRTKEIEFYYADRFICEGGTGWNGDPEIDFTEQLLRIIPHRDADVMPTADVGPVGGPRPDWRGPTDDATLIEKMLSGPGSINAQFGNKASLRHLWEADPVALGKFYPDAAGTRAYDASMADAALMSHLAFWTGCDAARMDRMFAQSGLMRDKWLTRGDYRKMTISGATKRCQNVYQAAQVAGEDGVAVSDMDSPVMSTSQQVEYFADCTYVCDAHRVLLSSGEMISPDRFKAYMGGYEFMLSMGTGRPTKSAFEAFTENRAHRFPKAMRTTFRPDVPFGHIEDGDVNVFKRHEPKMDVGDVTLFKVQMKKLFPDEGDHAGMMAYLAALVQYQGYKFLWSPVVQGTKGNGKSMLASVVAYCVGPKWSFPVDPQKIDGQFNDYIEHKVFLSVDEIHMGDQRTFLDRLKPLITDDRIATEGKGKDQKPINNVANWYFTTNHKSAVIKEADDRRFAVYFTPHQTRDDVIRDGMGGDYWPNFWNWLRSVGFARVAHYLMTYDIPQALNPAVSAGGGAMWAPHTSSTREAMESSLGPLEMEITEAVESGVQGFKGGWISSTRLDELVHDKHIRIGRARRNEILSNMGYTSIGRSTSMIFQEGMKRPTLYVRGDVKDRTTEAFCAAQGYS